MTDTVTRIDYAAEAKPFLGAQIDAKFKGRLSDDAVEAGFFIRLTGETLHVDEMRLREILLDLRPDGLEAAKLAANFMTCCEMLQGISDLMKTVAGRVFLTLEQMEVDGEITATETIMEPLECVINGIAADAE
jgi:hypothetical protein